MARQFKPTKVENPWQSRAAGSCVAVAVILLLVHPAQYLGALTPGVHSANGTQKNPLDGWHQSRPGSTQGGDPWFNLRSQVEAGSYIELCSQWRSQQRGSASDKLPRNLENKARAHCRLLP
ncbi:hypothetical protein [Microbulbifer taiwanensis]|uniref:Uncharacterized protein n=1 Tax=Microbulbifer taiwanensis TaxID=986746 RepID=A0ABW1YSW9_9GAMM|nr:hypothetical protein [Microbulbifer taiwanensis]